MKHAFTETMLAVLDRHFGPIGPDVFENSSLLQYLNVKTRSANRGSKARGAFANHYALYVLVEDYINGRFHTERHGGYKKYEGARFTDLFRRQRELPFGAKLQNHALNSRLNDEFAKYFPTLDARPIIRDQKEQRYWVNESLLEVAVAAPGGKTTVNIAPVIIEIIDAYVEAKRSAFGAFLDSCRELAALSDRDPSGAIDFVNHQLQPNVDARIFEIVSFAILKANYGEQSIFWGWSADELQQEFLVLYKTGRTNANDGGIDFVMRPLGRFFQVTETIDANKYFLDIDKIQRFPLTFVVKTNDSPDAVQAAIRDQARQKYGIEAVVNRYLEAVEEVINIPMLLSIFHDLVRAGRVRAVMDEIILQSRVEFNYEVLDDDDSDEREPESRPDHVAE
jgi:hypothetical protein